VSVGQQVVPGEVRGEERKGKYTYVCVWAKWDIGDQLFCRRIAARQDIELARITTISTLFFPHPRSAAYIFQLMRKFFNQADGHIIIIIIVIISGCIAHLQQNDDDDVVFSRGTSQASTFLMPLYCTFRQGAKILQQKSKTLQPSCKFKFQLRCKLK